MPSPAGRVGAQVERHRCALRRASVMLDRIGPRSRYASMSDATSHLLHACHPATAANSRIGSLRRCGPIVGTPRVNIREHNEPDWMGVINNLDHLEDTCDVLPLTNIVGTSPERRAFVERELRLAQTVLAAATESRAEHRV